MNERIEYVENRDAAVSPYIVSMARGELVGIAITGALTGLITIVLAYILNKFVFGAILCRGTSLTECARTPEYAMAVAIILGAVVALFNLVRIRTYRSLLVVIAATLSLWGFTALVWNMPWYVAGIVSILLFALSYLLFAWLARIRSFVISVIAIVAMVVVTRLLLAA